MKLIREMDRATRTVTDPVEKAITEMGYDMDNVDPSELQRVVAHQRELGLDGQALLDAVGDDLEQLEYSPDAVEHALAVLAHKLGINYIGS